MEKDRHTKKQSCRDPDLRVAQYRMITHDPGSNCSKTMAAMVRKTYKRGVRECFFCCTTIYVLFSFKSISGPFGSNLGTIFGSFWGHFGPGGYPRDPFRTPGAPGADFGPLWGAFWVPSGLLWGDFWVPFWLSGPPGVTRKAEQVSQWRQRCPKRAVRVPNVVQKRPFWRPRGPPLQAKSPIAASRKT